MRAVMLRFYGVPRSLRLETIARTCGLGTAANLRIQLKRTTGLTPSDYRRRFALRSVS